jgi:transcriptional regulator with XRE-family HTH domain
MSESLGTRLRRHRERRGVTISEIAEQTKIKASLLEGLERDDVSQWPAGIFRRAYVRVYATAIGFDADLAVREFLCIHPDPPESIDTPVPPRGLRGFVASALGTLRRQPVSEPTSGVVPVAEKPVVENPFVEQPLAEKALVEKPALERTPINRPAAAKAAVGEKVASKPVDEVRAQAEPDAPHKPAARESELRAADLLVAAKICTELGRVEQTGQVLPLLRDAAKVLDARGLIVWIWDSVAEQLRPVFVHGYASKVRARLRGISRDADNVTAAAFRASSPLAKAGEEGTSSALAVPLLTPSGCGGVLALEVAPGAEQDPVVRALATFFAAMLAQLIGPAPADTAADPAALPALEAQPG